MKKKEPTQIQKYLWSIVPHGGNINPVSFLDTTLREIIGKTDKLEVGLCSHSAILQREIIRDGKNPEDYCRVCGKPVNIVGVMRCNDFLVFRNKKCPGPICGDCFENKPDVWYKKYRKSLDVYHAFNQTFFNLQNSLGDLDKELKNL